MRHLFIGGFLLAQLLDPSEGAAALALLAPGRRPPLLLGLPFLGLVQVQRRRVGGAVPLVRPRQPAGTASIHLPPLFRSLSLSLAHFVSSMRYR
ncbi:unnamed protein product [Musa acuminata var. zebrina]